VQSLYLESARVGHGSPVQVRDTRWVNGRETFEDPTAPQYIAWYARFGQPGERRANSIFAAHIDYVGYGAGPFRYLTSARVGDALHITLADGRQLTYTVKGVETIRLADLDMDAIVYPALDSNTERVTLISCGGTFVPHASGVGGDYDSRVFLYAERQVP
jgi:sortase (surface protein transpeptidase)